MDNKFKTVVTALCADHKQAGIYVIPALNKENKEAIVTEKDYNEIIEEYYGWADKIMRSYKLHEYGEHWWQSTRAFDVFKVLMHELLYDGTGFMVPTMAGYVQKDAAIMRQQLSPVEVRSTGGRTIKIGAYNMDEDERFNGFLYDVFTHADHIEEHLKLRKSELGAKVEEKIDELNTDDTGRKELAKPYEEELEKLTIEKLKREKQ
jgi:hypothetical protein